MQVQNLLVQEMVHAMGGGNVNIMNEAKVNTISSNQTHMTEDTSTNDKKR